MIACIVTGNGIHAWLHLPAVPRVGDHLWLSSLTRGAVSVTDARVVKVEWARDQTVYEQDKGIHVWLTVVRSRRPRPA